MGKGIRPANRKIRRDPNRFQGKGYDEVRNGIDLKEVASSNTSRHGTMSLKATVAIGSEYETNEIEFLKAVDYYKTAFRRPFPTWSEILSIVIWLGYKK